MKRHIVTRTERNILSGLKRWNKDAPEEVLTAEARYRLQRLVLGANEAGETQEAIAARLGYSVSQVERIIRTAKRDRADGKVPPLAAWQAHDEAMRAEPKEAAPEPDDAEPEPSIAELKARIKGLVEAQDAKAVEDNERPGPVYAVTPHTHFKIRSRDEYIVVDDMRCLKPGVQVSFIASGPFGPMVCHRTVRSIQQMHQSPYLSLQVGKFG